MNPFKINKPFKNRMDYDVDRIYRNNVKYIMLTDVS